MLQESNRIEFKAELNDKLEKEIGAFLNNKEGGVCARRRKQKRRGGFHIRPRHLPQAARAHIECAPTAAENF